MKSNIFLVIISILGLLAAAYMLIANIFMNKDYSIVAIIAGLISPLYFYMLSLQNKEKKK